MMLSIDFAKAGVNCPYAHALAGIGPLVRAEDPAGLLKEVMAIRSSARTARQLDGQKVDVRICIRSRL